MKIGIIGCGEISFYHVEAISQVERLYAEWVTRVQPIEIESLISVVLKYEKGVLGDICSTVCTQRLNEAYLQIFGTAGQIRLFIPNLKNKMLLLVQILGMRLNVLKRNLFGHYMWKNLFKIFFTINTDYYWLRWEGKS